EISDFLRNRLTDELTPHHAIVNREVQIRRNKPAGIGERTDLRIDAPNSDSGTVTVVIEVKTAWNNEVTSALPTQLVNRYMTDIGTTAGIFLVLWANAESWPGFSSTPPKAYSGNRATLTDLLHQQASEQTAHGRDVRVIHLDISYLRTTQNK